MTVAKRTCVHFLVLVGLSWPLAAAAKGGGPGRQLARALLRDNRYLLKRDLQAVAAKAELLGGSAFIYYRAAAARSYALARTLGQLRDDLPQLLGNLDLHINGNTGSVAGRRWRAVDQDEAGHKAPFTTGIVRWGAGVYLAAAEQGLTREQAAEVVQAMAHSYVKTLRGYPAIPTAPETHRQLMKEARAGATKRRKGKLKKDGRFKPHEKSLAVDDQMARELDAAYARYVGSLGARARKRIAAYEIVDRVERIASGGGSRGLLRYRLSLVPKKARGKNRRAQAVVLEIKEQPPSPARDAFGETPLDVKSEAERVIVMRRRQGAASPLDGFTELAGRSFSVIEQRFDEAALDLTRLRSATVRRDLAQADGAAAAIAHLGSGLGNARRKTVAKQLLGAIEGGRYANADDFAHKMAKEAADLAGALRAQHATYVGEQAQRGALEIMRRYLRRQSTSR